MAVVAAVAFVVAAAVGYLVTELGSRAHVDTGTGPAGSFDLGSPGAYLLGCVNGSLEATRVG